MSSLVRSIPLLLLLLSTSAFADALASARAAYDGASRGSPTWQEAALRYGQIAAHYRKFATAKAVLGDLLQLAPGHPRSREVGAMISRIDARFRVDRTAVGVLLPLSGKFGRYGRLVKRGIELAAGQYPGMTMKFRDTQGRSHLASEAVRDLVEKENVVAIIGPIGQSASLAAAKLAEHYGVPIVTLTRREGITDLGPFVFRNFLTNELQGRTMARYAVKVLGLKDFAILFPNNTYGWENMRGFWDEAVRLGGTMRAVEKYSPFAKEVKDPVRKLVGSYWLKLRPDFWKAYRKAARRARGYRQRRKAWERAIKNLKPVVDFDAVFVPDFAHRLPYVVPWLKYYDVEFFTENIVRLDRLKLKYGRKKPKLVYLLGTNGWNSDRLHTRIGDLVWRAVFCDSLYERSDYAPYTGFVNLYRDRYASRPNFLAAIGFDTYRILHQVITKSNAPTREAVRDELRKVKNFPGATGRTSLDGRDVSKELHILSIERSRHDVNKYEIKPVPSKQTDILYPRAAPPTQKPAGQPEG